jgi:hypothetical protein
MYNYAVLKGYIVLTNRPKQNMASKCKCTYEKTPFINEMERVENAEEI